MKSKIIMFILAALLGISLTACGDGGSAKNVSEETQAAEIDENAVDEYADEDEIYLDDEDYLDDDEYLDDEEVDFEELFGDDEDYSMEVPDCVQNLSEEDEILLNGELKDGVYTNRYFGYKLTAPAGGTLVRENDDATETDEIMPLSQTYEEGWGGLYFSAEVPDVDGSIDIYISAREEEEAGLSEEELVKKSIQEIWEIEETDGPEFDTAVLAGEEHPVCIWMTEEEGEELLSASFIIPKGDFLYTIYIDAYGAKLEDLTKYFEKI